MLKSVYRLRFTECSLSSVMRQENAITPLFVKFATEVLSMPTDCAVGRYIPEN